VEWRRRFSVEQKLAVLSEAMAPGVNISAVARRHGLLPAQVYKWSRLAELGVIGVPGVLELPSFVAVEITKDVRSLPAPVLEDKPTTADDTPRRRPQESGADRDRAGERAPVRVDRDADAAALERVLDVSAGPT
jgi:transposase